jgi:hypothetical protein
VVALEGEAMTGTSRFTTLLALANLVLISGCVTQKPTLYDWGEYEELIYQMYSEPGKAEPGTQVAKLSEDIGRMQAEGKRVPPGVHAHLGYMHYIQGNQGAAMSAFAIEKALFPESAVFVDAILKRLKGKQQ